MYHPILRRYPALLAALCGIACASAARPTRAAPATSQALVAFPADSIAGDSVATALLRDVRQLDPSIVVEMRYGTSNNFTGAPLPGYHANRALLRMEAAAALARVSRAVADSGWALKVWDAYRPVRATRAMVEWARRTGRQDLFAQGYISARSRHNLGLAVDLTLVERATGRELEMGTEYDTFSEAAHTANATGAVAVNRRRLARAMAAAGFASYEKEWWHFAYAVRDPVPFDVLVTSH